MSNVTRQSDTKARGWCRGGNRSVGNYQGGVQQGRKNPCPICGRKVGMRKGRAGYLYRTRRSEADNPLYPDSRVQRDVTVDITTNNIGLTNMKTGRSLQEIAAILEQQRETKRDFLVDTRKIEIIPPAPALVDVAKATKAIAPLHLALSGSKGVERFGVRTHALRQLEEHLGVPAKFADRLHEQHPDLLAYTMNELLHRGPSTQLVRTLDKNMRAFLSNSYRVIDNYEYAEAVLDVASKYPNVKVHSAEITESRIYIKVVREDRVKQIGFKEGWRQGEGHNLYDEVKAAAVFSNSEIGAGRLWFRPGVWTRNCTNLAVWEQEGFSKVHLGKKADAGEEGFWEMLSDKTKELSDAALLSQIRDLTAAALDGRFFEEQVAQLQGATTRKIEGDVPKCVELAAKTFQLSEGERKGVLNHLIQGGQLTQYGLHSAITRFSQDIEDYDRASELERLGGRIIELPQGEWKKLAEAA